MKKLKQRLMSLVKKILSPRQKEVIKAVLEFPAILPHYIIDLYRYVRYSATAVKYRDRDLLASVIIKNYHAIEKGLALPHPRPGFGESLIKRTIFFLDRYEQYFGIDDVYCHAFNAIEQYVAFNKNTSSPVPLAEDFVLSKKDRVGQEGVLDGGVNLVKKADILALSSGSFSELVNARHSVRNFQPGPIADEVIHKAVALAQKTPSVCNRPTTKIFSFEQEEIKRKILDLQNGNRGFGYGASQVFIITADLRCFNGAKERNQSFVDGGLMAMSFVYALQSYGIGTCFLNWSADRRRDNALKKLTNIPDYYNIVTLIVAGNIPDELYITHSPKKRLNNFWQPDQPVF